MKLPLLLATLEQFEDQATDRLLLSLMEEYGDSGTIQRKVLRRHQPNATINYSLSESRTYKLHMLSVGVLAYSFSYSALAIHSYPFSWKHSHIPLSLCFVLYRLTLAVAVFI